MQGALFQSQHVSTAPLTRGHQKAKLSLGWEPERQTGSALLQRPMHSLSVCREQEHLQSGPQRQQGVSVCEHHLTGGRSVALGQHPSARSEVHMYVSDLWFRGIQKPFGKSTDWLRRSQLVEQLESLGETSGAVGSGGPRDLASSLVSCSQTSRLLREPQTPVILSPHLPLGRFVEDKRPLTYFPLV